MPCQYSWAKGQTLHFIQDKDGVIVFSELFPEMEEKEPACVTHTHMRFFLQLHICRCGGFSLFHQIQSSSLHYTKLFCASKRHNHHHCFPWNQEQERVSTPEFWKRWVQRNRLFDCKQPKSATGLASCARSDRLYDESFPKTSCHRDSQ